MRLEHLLSGEAVRRVVHMFPYIFGLVLFAVCPPVLSLYAGDSGLLLTKSYSSVG